MADKKIKMVVHSPSFTEFCEGCGATKEGVKDLEVQSHTGRQILRTFLCKPCRSDMAGLWTKELVSEGPVVRREPHRDTGGPDQGGEFVRGMPGHPDNEMGM
jgi:hypothetical protein